MLIYQRDTKQYKEELEYKKNTLDFLYNTVLGRILLKLIVARPWFSKFKARYQNSPQSQKDIKPFIEKYNINANADNYQTFNEFFTRKRDYFSQTKPNELIAIADSKLSVYQISEDLKLNIKNSAYSIAEILNTDKVPDELKNGYCLIFRLAMDDYHRYVFLDNGKIERKYFVKGLLHTVRPIASKYKVYSRNCREITVLNTENFGKVVQIEVGAMLVGKINNHDIAQFKKLEEKGYFEYGGSTIILLLNKNIEIDRDIVNETQVFIGERIGVLCSKD